MHLVTLDYSMATQSLDLFVSGCNMSTHCHHCQNAEAWSFDVGKPWRQWLFEINDNIKDFGSMIKRIFILGGEPLDQYPDEFSNFIACMKEYNKELWLFTRYEFDQIDYSVKNQFDYIKTGPYKEELTTTDHVEFNVRLATSNQHVWKKIENGGWIRGDV